MSNIMFVDALESVRRVSRDSMFSRGNHNYSPILSATVTAMYVASYII
jgi:hypothetical protein